MFFYLYAVIELLAMFLDSNVIPTANVSYPVSAILCLPGLHLTLVCSGLRQCTQASWWQRTPAYSSTGS